MIKIIEDDIINAKEEIIIQQVNCQGVMGSGVAKAIREKYPEIYGRYKDICVSNTIILNKPSSNLLGEVLGINTNDGKDVVCIFGQDNYGNDGKRYTNYPALFSGLSGIFQKANVDIAMPYKIGCYRGGGDWEGVVYPFLQACALDFPYDIVLYKYNK